MGAAQPLALVLAVLCRWPATDKAIACWSGAL